MRQLSVVAAAEPGVYTLVREPKCSTIVVHCSDPRWQVVYQQFIALELGLGPGGYMPLVVSGGAGVLAHRERLPKDFKFVRDRLEFYRTVMPSIWRLVLINHEGCRYYQAMKRRVLGPKAPEDAAHDDLRVVQQVLAPTTAKLGLTTELYYARFTDPHLGQVTFEPTL